MSTDYDSVDSDHADEKEEGKGYEERNDDADDSGEHSLNFLYLHSN
jgi:hypothetical protein